MSNTATLSAETRQLIVSKLAAALAAAWRRQHGCGERVDRDDGSVSVETEEELEQVTAPTALLR